MLTLYKTLYCIDGLLKKTKNHLTKDKGFLFLCVNIFCNLTANDCKWSQTLDLGENIILSLTPPTQLVSFSVLYLQSLPKLHHASQPTT